MRCRKNVDGSCVEVRYLVGSPVADKPVNFAQSLGNVFAFDPVDRVDTFACTSRVHADAADISCTAKQSESIRHCWCCDNCRRREGGEYASACYALQVGSRHSATCPVLLSSAVSPPMNAPIPTGVRFLWPIRLTDGTASRKFAAIGASIGEKLPIHPARGNRFNLATPACRKGHIDHSTAITNGHIGAFT